VTGVTSNERGQQGNPHSGTNKFCFAEKTREAACVWWWQDGLYEVTPVLGIDLIESDSQNRFRDLGHGRCQGNGGDLTSLRHLPLFWGFYARIPVRARERGRSTAYSHSAHVGYCGCVGSRQLTLFVSAVLVRNYGPKRKFPYSISEAGID
jgi:hypothetical protein